MWETSQTSGRCCELSCQICLSDELMETHLYVYLCGFLLSTLWKYRSKIFIGARFHAGSEKCACELMLYFLHLIPLLLQEKLICLICRRCVQICNQSSTDLTLQAFLDHFCQDACEFSAAKVNMTSSQLVHDKFPFWLKLKEEKWVIFFPWHYNTLQERFSARAFV